MLLKCRYALRLQWVDVGTCLVFVLDGEKYVAKQHCDELRSQKREEARLKLRSHYDEISDEEKGMNVQLSYAPVEI